MSSASDRGAVVAATSPEPLELPGDDLRGRLDEVAFFIVGHASVLRWHTDIRDDFGAEADVRKLIAYVKVARDLVKLLRAEQLAEGEPQPVGAGRERSAA
jgi:hypothetical protein